MGDIFFFSLRSSVCFTNLNRTITGVIFIRHSLSRSFRFLTQGHGHLELRISSVVFAPLA